MILNDLLREEKRSCEIDIFRNLILIYETSSFFFDVMLRIIFTNVVKLIVMIIENVKVITFCVFIETFRVFIEILCVFIETFRVYIDNFIKSSKIRKKTIFILVEHFYTFMMIVRTVFAVVFDRNALTLRKSIMNQNAKTSTFTTYEKFLLFFFKQRKQ